MGVSEKCALPGYYAASSGNRRAITQKSAILRYIAAEAWNHASWNVTTHTAYRWRCINCVQPVYHSTLINILWSLRNKQMRFHLLKYWVRVLLPAASASEVGSETIPWLTAMNRERSTVHICANKLFSRLLSVNEERHNIRVYIHIYLVCVCVRARACACVCACVRERERERESCFHRKFFVCASFADQIVGNSKSFTFPQNIKGVIQILFVYSPVRSKNRFRLPRGLRRRSDAVHLLWLWVPIPPMARMFVSLSVVCC